MNAKKFEQSYSELQSINAAHNLAPVDLVKEFAASLTVKPGTLLKRATHDLLKQAVIAGGAAGALTVTGVNAGDRLVSVVRLNRDGTAANIDLADLTSEFSISADDEIDNTGGTDTTGDKLIVTYEQVGAGTFTPWIQGTDHPEVIAGVFAAANDLDTDTDTFGLVRVFGPVRKDKLIAWTAANGSTTAAPNAAALAQLEAQQIYAL